ncbi:hypothetical protein [Schinkia azotoformans]|uniref:hypothetical protein n=1 Tax=Schinkia azotoformans TaxID=1454 RepID=UPI003D282C54
MIDYKTKKCKLYGEINEHDQKKFFDYKSKKFLHNIDSLYYVVKVKNDWNKDSGCRRFVDTLEIKKRLAIKSYDPVVVYDTDKQRCQFDLIMNGIGSKPYMYDLEKKDKYIIFIMNYQLNEKTPELWVQIRAQALWLQGEYEIVNESIKDVTELLSSYNIEIDEIKENRIDWAYHTNYIQDPLNFFKEEDLNRMQESRFTRYSSEGVFVGQFEVDKDYITLGRKKSNNLFFRIYNKTKEVIEKGYKQFFIKLWYLENMINYFDYYCVEKAFLNHNYKYLDVARLEFYLEFGKDNLIKDEINNLINKQSRDFEKIKALADLLVPAVTLVLNVELETKRKFYYSLDTCINILLKLKSDCPAFARSLYLKLDNKQVFHNYLTCNTSEQSGIIRFLNYKAKNKNGESWTRKSKFPTAQWWQRLQSVKVNRKFDSEDVTLIREYQKTLDIDKIKKRLVNSVLTHKVYLNTDNLDSTFEEDLLDFISNVNENDTENAISYKRKKFTLLKNRLADLEKTDSKRTFKLLDSETGEIID